MGASSKAVTAPPPAYAVMYPGLVAIARKHGYALAIHGSMKRDFDLIAVPWVGDAGEPFAMIMEMKEAVQGVFTNHEMEHLSVQAKGHPTLKAHGRLCWSIHLTNEGAFGPYLDICVMPRGAL